MNWNSIGGTGALVVETVVLVGGTGTLVGVIGAPVRGTVSLVRGLLALVGGTSSSRSDPVNASWSCSSCFSGIL